MHRYRGMDIHARNRFVQSWSTQIYCLPARRRRKNAVCDTQRDARHTSQRAHHPATDRCMRPRCLVWDRLLRVLGELQTTAIRVGTFAVFPLCNRMTGVWFIIIWRWNEVAPEIYVPNSHAGPSNNDSSNLTFLQHLKMMMLLNSMYQQ